MRNLVISLAFLSLALATAPGLARGMVKYSTPDGKIGFASPELVPEGATIESSNYQPSGQVTVSPRSGEAEDSRKKRAAAKAAVRQRSSAQADREERARAIWAEKARTAQLELENAERNYEKWTTRCRDAEDHHSLYELPPGCSSYEKSRLDAALQKLEEKRDWADDGLFDACRRSEECLPGYIR